MARIKYNQVVITALLSSGAGLLGMTGLLIPARSFGRGSVAGRKAEAPGPVVSASATLLMRRQTPAGPSAQLGRVANSSTDRRDSVPYADSLRPSIRKLFDAIRQVESGGNDYAIGDGGRALGAYQITRDYWQDAIEYGDVDWDYDTYVWSAPHCRAVMFWYWTRYGAWTLEERARTHTAGPDGPWQECSLEYWNKVKAIIERSLL